MNNALEGFFKGTAAFAALGTGVVIDGSIKAAIVLLVVAGAALACGTLAERIGAWR